MRLNRYLAAAGLGSRRGCEQLIRDGKVTVNGEVCLDLATTVAEGDSVKVNNKLIRQEKHFYVALNKPPGYVCTASDELGRRTIFELLPKNWPRLFNIGRLDKETEGLLILTNDGDLALRLTHPRYKIDKEYEVILDKPFDLAHREKLLRGVFIEGGRARAESVRHLGPNHLKMVLRQGLKRQIRLMMYDLGYEVKRLMRTRIGRLRLDIHPGEWRLLGEREVKSLLEDKSESARRERVSSATGHPARRQAGETRGRARA
jgi:23S rRNA pseudouridine2605 synthase